MMNNRLYLIIYILLLLGAASPALAQTIKGNVYGGGQLGKVAGNTNVTIESGSVTTGTSGGSNVFGGGYQAEVAGNTAIAINGGEAGNVYGGGEAADIVVGAAETGNTVVSMNGGTIHHSVYGGGLGNTTNVATSTTVTANGGTVTEDVYGGSGFGKVGATTVIINDGAIVTRDVFGGGFGSITPNNYEADVKGNASVTINKGASISGNVYGGNNTNGSPKGTVTVLVDGPVDGSEPALSLQDVFGGGKNAATLSSAAPAVTIQGCATEVERVFGGGDAASVPATNVIIKGGHIGQAFAGGNGEVVAAHVGYAANGTTPYASGTGNANMSIQGGVVDDAFGGSNTAGNIRGTVEVEVDKADDACDLAITNLFGGGNKANGKAATIAIACTGNGKIENVFGGANQADVEGDITLNITGGNIGNIFGGNNQSGIINGAIAVNINWGSDDCGIKHIDNVYGGGNLAPYTTPGGKAHPTITLTNGTVSHNIFGGGLGATAIMTGNPVVNINGGAVDGSVYGGGEQANVDGSTYVTISGGRLGADIFGGGQGLLNGDGSVKESADVSGTTHVTINGGEFAVEYDNEAPGTIKPFKEHYNIYGGGNIASIVGESHVYAQSGMIAKGSDNSGTSGAEGSGTFLMNSNAQGIAQAYYHEGQMYFCIFGGGYGKNTSVTGDTWVDFNIDGMVDIKSTAIENDLLEYQSYLDVIGGGFNGTVGGNTNVHVGGNAMCRNVYGGGLYATIGNKGRGETGETNVHITGGNIDNVYGGGVMGDIMTSTNVNIGLASALDFDTHNYTANNDHITILMSVYGGNDVSGHVPQANITHNGGTVDQNIYGAGNGDYRGYYTPNQCDYADGENDNYYMVDHKDGIAANNGPTYKGRPQTEDVNITMGGNSDSDKAVVLGQVFGGGNSCTIGSWVTPTSGDAHDGDPHKWRNDPAYFLGGGTLNITLNSHVVIGQDNEHVSEDYKNADGENVSGLFMGASGSVLATQSDAANYHHYYDATAKQYKPGFSSTDGEDAFKAYLNNILIWSDNVSLAIDNDAEDIWLANFVGGGFRGSMKRQTATNYSWVLPAGVTVGNCIVGGAYNADVKYVNAPLDLHYAGGLLQNDGTTFADVVLNLSNNMDGGEAAGVFGGCYSSGTVQNTQIDYSATNAHSVYGGGALANITGNSVVNLLGGTLINAYGGGLGRMADAEHDIPAVEALVGGNATVTLNGATAGNIFGCNNINGAPQGAVTVTTTSGTVNHNVYGGGNQAAASVSPIVNINGGTITENVYGGGYGVTAVITGSPVITVTGGTVTQDVFGGGSLANTNGSTTITVSGGEVTRDVYGGGALANVTGNTTVDLTGGSIGSAYGGGLGRLADIENDITAVEALVEGNATVTLGKGVGEPDENGKYSEYTASKVTGSIFGANNVNGTPKGHVKVHVRHTVPHDEQSEPRNTHDVKNSFDVLAVYGGGNKAAYIPTNLNDSTEVLIENCENSIAYVYGGGNAAPVPATKVNIHGANAIDYAFAGGNGQTEGQGAGDNPGADVGYLGYYSTGGAKEYGAGTSHIWIYGGTVYNVFGGSNTLGYIRTHAYVDIPEFDGGSCLLEVGNVHAGGNKAEMFCGGSMTLACSEGVNTIFAGSNSADIYGDIELNINSGTYSNIFGGNNTSGNVHGSITINIDETGCWPVMIGNLYGCGNQAAYSVYGYNTDQEKTPRTKEQYAALTEQDKEDIKNAHGIAIPYKDPVINVVSFTRIDHIFGGGKGSSATVYGNPTVNINTIKGEFAGETLTPAFVLNDDSQRVDNTVEITIPDEPGTIGSVYGGGDAAPVVGNTRVNIGTEATAKHISGNDMMKKEAQPVTVTILGNVFGGSKGVSNNPAAGRVTGTTKVVIGDEK